MPTDWGAGVWVKVRVTDIAHPRPAEGAWGLGLCAGCLDVFWYVLVWYGQCWVCVWGAPQPSLPPLAANTLCAIHPTPPSLPPPCLLPPTQGLALSAKKPPAPQAGAAARKKAATTRGAAVAAALEWLVEKEARELMSLRGQSSTWFFIEELSLGTISINVTLALNSNIDLSTGREAEPGAGKVGGWGRGHGGLGVGFGDGEGLVEA